MTADPRLSGDKLFAKELAIELGMSARAAREFLRELEKRNDEHHTYVGRHGTGRLKPQRFTTRLALSRLRPASGPTQRDLEQRVSDLETLTASLERSIARLTMQVERMLRLSGM